MRLTLEHCIMIERDSRIVFQKGLLQVSNKLGCVVRMVVDSVLYLMRKAGQMTIGKGHPPFRTHKKSWNIILKIISRKIIFKINMKLKSE